jgi:steroid 5-alpha reductase family enzyme
MNTLLVLGAVALGFNIVLFIPAFLYKTDRLTDISYALTFIILAVVGLAQSNREPAHIVLFFAVLVWALRLGGFLLVRIWNMKRDKRFDEMRGNFWLFLRFWVLQGSTVFVVMLASLLFWRQRAIEPSYLSIFGMMIFAVGLSLEAIADGQKYEFNQDPKNKGKWIETGVWSISRHPNYLGEMMVWAGLYIYVFDELATSERIAGLLSPLYIIGLLLFVSGIPILEKSADVRWGKDKNYRAYKQRVPRLLPVIRLHRRTTER